MIQKVKSCSDLAILTLCGTSRGGLAGGPVWQSDLSQTAAVVFLRDSQCGGKSIAMSARISISRQYCKTDSNQPG